MRHWGNIPLGAAGPPPLINLGDHSLRMGVTEDGGFIGTAEFRVRTLGAAQGFLEVRFRNREDPGFPPGIDYPILYELDGVTVVDNFESVYPLPILALPSNTQVLANSSTDGLRIGFTNEYTSNPLTFGGSFPDDYIGDNVYEWRWTLISGEPAQQLSNAPNGSWVSIGNATVSFWRWDGIPPIEFTSTFRIDIRDALDVIVGTGTFTIERFLLP